MLRLCRRGLRTLESCSQRGLFEEVKSRSGEGAQWALLDTWSRNEPLDAAVKPETSYEKAIAAIIQARHGTVRVTLPANDPYARIVDAVRGKESPEAKLPLLIASTADAHLVYLASKLLVEHWLAAQELDKAMTVLENVIPAIKLAFGPISRELTECRISLLGMALMQSKLNVQLINDLSVYLSTEKTVYASVATAESLVHVAHIIQDATAQPQLLSCAAALTTAALRMYSQLEDAAFASSFEESCINQLGSIELKIGDYFAAASYFEQALRIRRWKQPNDPLAALSIQANLASAKIAEAARVSVHEGAAMLQECIDIYAATSDLDDQAKKDYAQVLYIQASVVPQRRIELLQQCLEIRESVFPDPHERIAMTNMQLGAMYKSQGQTTEAINALQRSIAMYTAIDGGQRSPDHLMALQHLSGAYIKAKKWDEALETIEKFIDDIQPILVPQVYNAQLIQYIELLQRLGHTSTAEDVKKRLKEL